MAKECLGGCSYVLRLDGNNHMFPIVWAIVDVEDKENWRWFLDCLINSLDLKNGAGITIIFDMQKLQKRHYHRLNTDGMQDMCMQIEVKTREGEKAAVDLLKYTPHKWCKAYINARYKCDMVDNNVRETFNSWVNEFRDRPPITLLKEIRKKVMKRISNYKILLPHGKVTSHLIAWLQLSAIFLLSTECEILDNCDDGYEVSHGDDQHIEIFNKKSCTCRLWDISGIPCAHEIVALYHAKKNPFDYICNYFNKMMFQNAYHFSLQPAGGGQMLAL
ncbi:uncharacterized protein LOC126657126 [Mercurialis annua]|uniref:uncharacterized protein LOC126657126 n=1 Tax=Mercurialis annua TaxID=3986 RepID=UPI00215FE6C0|nr:uncharacterized protein LOC126657126 [Mercurialis annua]